MSVTLTRPPTTPLPTRALTDTPVPPRAALDDVAVAAPASPPSATARPVRRRLDIVEEWGMQSFPASDPPSNW
jgi:hypothetical protein